MCVAAMATLATMFGGGTAAAGTAAAGTGIASTLATAATLASAGVGAYSAIRSGNAAEAAAQATARQQEQAARDSMRRGEDESDQRRRAGAAILAQQRVAMAANGIDVSSASAIEHLDSTRKDIEADAFAIRKNARLQADGYSQQASNSLAEGANAASAGMWGAAGTLLSVGAKVGDKYSSWARSRTTTPRYA